MKSVEARKETIESRNVKHKGVNGGMCTECADTSERMRVVHARSNDDAALALLLGLLCGGVDCGSC